MEVTKRQTIWRYLCASVFNVILGAALLAIGFDLLKLSALTANLFAVLLGTGPMYLVSRRWVWPSEERSQFFRHIVPFWSLTLIGWVFSSVAVIFASRLGDHLKIDRSLQTLLVVAASLFAYGTVWILRFFILDRLVFARPDEIREPLS